MQVDFYHLTRDPVEKLVPMLASKCFEADAKLLLVSRDEDQRGRLSKALWSFSPTSFLAHDLGGSEYEQHQPILLSEDCKASNGASFILIADGNWRSGALDFDRAFFLFTEEKISDARITWRELTAKENVVPRYWKQQDGRWMEGP